jgi:hypothetical protein
MAWCADGCFWLRVKGTQILRKRVVSIVVAGREHAEHQMSQKKVQSSQILLSLQDSSLEEREEQKLILMHNLVVNMKISIFRCFWASQRILCACFRVWDCRPRVSCPSLAHCWRICPFVTTISIRARPSGDFRSVGMPLATPVPFCADHRGHLHMRLSQDLCLPFLMSTLRDSYWPLLWVPLLLPLCCPSERLRDRFLEPRCVIVVSLLTLPCASRFILSHTNLVFFWLAIYRIYSDIRCESCCLSWREDFMSKFRRDVVVNTIFIGLVYFMQQQNSNNTPLAAAHCIYSFLSCHRQWACFIA